MKSEIKSLDRILLARRTQILFVFVSLALSGPPLTGQSIATLPAMSRVASQGARQGPLARSKMGAQAQVGDQAAKQAAKPATKPASKPATKPAKIAGKPAEKPLVARGKKQELLFKLHRILDAMQRSVMAIVSPERLEARLRGRTLKYRQIPMAKGGAANNKAPVAGELPRIDQLKERKGRLLGDQEKAAIAKGVVMTVDGLPVLESEIDKLAEYYGSYMAGSKNEHKTKAIAEIIKVRVAEARYKDKLALVRQRIDAIYQKVTVSKEDFAEVAKVDSEGPSGANGGNLDFFAREGMVGPFARWAFTLGIGKISPVFASPFGYHIVKVTGRQKGATPAMDQVKASHILVMFTRNTEELKALMQAAESGKSDVAVFSREWRQLLPQSYR